MKTIAALVTLICILGLSSAQTIFTGEGYSASQLAFYNSPGESTFEPDVQQYWGSYITGNATQKSGLMSDIEIWMNTFPLKFNNPLQVKSTSFTANASGLSLSESEMNSMLLTRDVNTQFSYYQNWRYTPPVSSLSLPKTDSAVPSKDAGGQILSQGIISLFNV